MQRRNIIQKLFFTIQGRILINFLVVGILSTVAALIILRQREDIDQKYNFLATILQPSKALIFSLSNSVNTTNILLQQYIAASDNAENYEQRINDLWENDIKNSLLALNEYQKQWLDMEIKIKLATLQSTLQKLRKLQQETEEYISREASISIIYNEVQEVDEKVTAEQFFNTKVYPAVNQFSKEVEVLNKLQDEYVERFKKDLREIKRFYQSTWTFVAIALIVVIITVTYSLSISILGNIRRVKEHAQKFGAGNLPQELQKHKDETQEIIQEFEHLKTNLLQIKQFAFQVGNGNFESNTSIFDSQSDIGSALENMRLGLINVAIEDKRRNWFNEGIALFNNILREGSQSSEELYEHIIINLIQYTKTNQGGLFILNDENPDNIFMELKAVYAYERKRFMQKIVYLGQGLIGQSWIEKDLIYIRGVEADFIQISSGLGTAKPKNLLIVPMITNDNRVLGIFEVASFHEFEAHEINFVKAIGNIVVSAISASKNNEKNQQLLAEAQASTLKMKEQENMYKRISIEYEVLQEKSQNAENKVIAYKNANESVLAILEMSIEGTIEEANLTFLDITGYQLESLVGKNHSFLLKSDETNTLAYRRIWEELKEGIIHSLEMSVITKEGKEAIFQTVLTPIQDYSGNYHKVLQVSLDLTKERRLRIEYQTQAEAINKHLPIIEFDMKGNIIYANNLFLELMEYQLGEIKGKHHGIFITSIERESNQYKELWRKLNRGEVATGKFKRITKNADEVWIRASYYPIFDINGKPYKVIKYIQDITDIQRLEIKARENAEIIKIQNEKIKAMEDQLRQILLNLATTQDINNS